MAAFFAARPVRRAYASLRPAVPAVVPTAERPRLVARWLRDADGQLYCIWESASDDVEPSQLRCVRRARVTH